MADGPLLLLLSLRMARPFRLAMATNKCPSKLLLKVCYLNVRVPVVESNLEG